MVKLRKIIGDVLIGALVLSIILPIAGFAAFVWLWLPPDTSDIVEDTDPSEVVAVSVERVDDPVFYAYGYDRCTYVSIPSIEARADDINVMEGGRVPAFRYGDGIYVVLHKGRNWSRGMVAGRYDVGDEKLWQFSFEPMGNGLAMWTLDLQKPRPTQRAAGSARHRDGREGR
jgi:hypothetical protein